MCVHWSVVSSPDPNVSCVRGDARNVISVAQLARSHGLVSVFELTVGYVRDTSTGKDVGRAYVREGDRVYVLEYLLIGEPQVRTPTPTPVGTNHIRR